MLVNCLDPDPGSKLMDRKQLNVGNFQMVSFKRSYWEFGRQDCGSRPDTNFFYFDRSGSFYLFSLVTLVRGRIFMTDQNISFNQGPDPEK